jgi:hypothetical protein
VGETETGTSVSTAELQDAVKATSNNVITKAIDLFMARGRLQVGRPTKRWNNRGMGFSSGMEYPFNIFFTWITESYHNWGGVFWRGKKECTEIFYFIELLKAIIRLTNHLVEGLWTRAKRRKTDGSFTSDRADLSQDIVY